MSLISPGRKLSDKARLRVDFYDIKESTSLTEQVAAWEFMLSIGGINEVDIIMERNPDFRTREEALAHLKQLQTERGKLIVLVPNEHEY